MNVKQELEKIIGTAERVYLNDIDVDPLEIRAIMINEVVPSDPSQDFYGLSDADYITSTISLFKKAGLHVESIQDILRMGVYITNAVKTPKSEYTIEKSSIEHSLGYLETEISLFPNVKVIMLMGDVAKKAFNMIAKKATKKPAVPSTSTYKLRRSEIYFTNIRVMPSYIMTGKNILIEKSKAEMACEDISIMAQIIQ
ncbi:MAG: uracil-DNA glycosylase [Sphaerochaeta sp.]|nr:uracil-DNA glycosylase [Sphaerochaeta sp.]